MCSRSQQVPASPYYETYHGHEVQYLDRILQVQRAKHSVVVYLAGDSSLDNKYWLDDEEDAVNGYEALLEPPVMKADICYWMNHFLQLRNRPGASAFCLNTAVEATTLRQRSVGWLSGGLLPQDELIRDNIGPNDFLVVSVGGNDIALSPTPTTVLSMLAMVHLSSQQDIEAGTAWGARHFMTLFGDQLRDYVQRLVEKQKPRKVLVCMIYYPDVHGQGWADTALSALKYNSTPQLLQSAISLMFERAVSQIRIEGTEVVPFPLFRVLDGSRSEDYVARVEPSVEGGRKMAQAFVREMFGT